MAKVEYWHIPNTDLYIIKDELGYWTIGKEGQRPTTDAEKLKLNQFLMSWVD